MYESHFRFQQRPFLTAPRADRYFASAAAESARTILARCIGRAEGPALLTGPSGTGKSLLLHVLAEQFRPDFEVALLSSARLNTPRALLQAVLYELGQPFRGLDEGELRLSLLDHLANHTGERQGLLLLVDESHLLPLRVLLEIRVLSNLVRRGAPGVRLVLAGAAALEERFAHPRLDSFNQRLAARCYLSAMDRAETEGFIRSQLAAAGAETTFQPDALARVFSAADGVPRLVNQLCDHALVLAFADGRTDVDAALVDSAWADLQQLPAPWNQGPRGAASQDASGGIIEIGALDDEEDESPNILGIGSDRSSRTARRLDDLDVHLAALHDDFQPAGPQPEIEFTPKTPAELFNEPFDEEEVVLDRYSQWDAVRSAVGQVTSRGDDASLAALLRAVERPPASPAVVRREMIPATVSSEVAALPARSAPVVRAVASPAELSQPVRKPAKYGNLFSQRRNPQ